MSRKIHQYECGCGLFHREMEAYIGLCPDHAEAFGHDTSLITDESCPMLGLAQKTPTINVYLNDYATRVPKRLYVQGFAYLSGSVVFNSHKDLPIDCRIEDVRQAMEEMFNEARFTLETKLNE